MRTLTGLLVLFVALAAPLVAEAGRGRSVGRMPVQPQAYKKPQTVTPEAPAVAQARQQHLAKLKTDLEAIAPKATPSKEQTTAVYQSLMAVVDGSNKPTPATVQKLSTDLAAMMSHRTAKAKLDTQTLAKNLKTVMNSAYVMTVDSHVATRNSQQLLKDAGAADLDAQVIAKDLKTIADQAVAQGRPGMIR